jgi:putative transposase
LILDLAVSAADRGRIVRELARRVYEHPDGSQRQYTRGTLDRWIRAYREQGLSGLKPELRSDLGTVRRHPELLDEACALPAEPPTRSAAQIAAILFARHRIRVAQRTINQHLRQRGLHRAALGGQPRAFGRFEVSRPNELWIGDVLVGPFVPYPRTSSSRRSYLFVLLDDYSRLILHARWVADQNTRAGQDVLRAAIQRRGVPERVYFDNGAPYSNAALERTCAVLGIRLIHSRPYAPEGRGKLERLNRFIRERFLAEADAHGIASFTELRSVPGLGRADVQFAPLHRDRPDANRPIHQPGSTPAGRAVALARGVPLVSAAARHQHGVRLAGGQSLFGRCR